MVASVLLSGPANGKLQAGDLIESIDGMVVSSRDDVAAVIRNRSVGDPVVFKVLRSGVSQTVSVVTTANGESEPIAGIDVGIGYSYTPRVEYRIDPSVVGPSAGLVFALAVYDKITEGELIGDRVVAVTGEVDASGRVAAIGGIREKMRGAERAGATVFVLPSDTCDDIGDFSTEMQLVPVATLKDAISALQLIKEGQSNMEVPTCE
nr:S16 family serine protease [Tessaracoccus sp. OS52]